MDKSSGKSEFILERIQKGLLVFAALTRKMEKIHGQLKNQRFGDNSGRLDGEKSMENGADRRHGLFRRTRQESGTRQTGRESDSTRSCEDRKNGIG